MKIQIGAIRLQISWLTNGNHAYWQTFCIKAKDKKEESTLHLSSFQSVGGNWQLREMRLFLSVAKKVRIKRKGIIPWSCFHLPRRSRIVNNLSFVWCFAQSLCLTAINNPSNVVWIWKWKYKLVLFVCRYCHLQMTIMRTDKRFCIKAKDNIATNKPTKKNALYV